MKNKGKAHGYFECKASREAIEAELPILRDVTQSSSELELFADTANEIGVKHVLASHPNRTNKETAVELGDILNQAYQSPLFEKGEEYRGGIAYKEDGKCVFVE